MPDQSIVPADAPLRSILANIGPLVQAMGGSVELSQALALAAVAVHALYPEPPCPPSQ